MEGERRRDGILSAHVLLERVHRQQSVLAAALVVVAVVRQVQIYIVLQFHIGGNNELHHVGEELRYVYSFRQLLDVRSSDGKPYSDQPLHNAQLVLLSVAAASLVQNLADFLHLDMKNGQ